MDLELPEIPHAEAPRAATGIMSSGRGPGRPPADDPWQVVNLRLPESWILRLDAILPSRKDRPDFLRGAIRAAIERAEAGAHDIHEIRDRPAERGSRKRRGARIAGRRDMSMAGPS